MLELAYANQQELTKKFLEISFVDKYKYFDFTNFINYELNLSKDSWSSLEYVSKKDNEIIGYLRASINRSAGFVSSLGVANFGDKNIEFAKDFYRFLEDLFMKFDFYKIRFDVVIGNPAEKMYDRFIKRYGGRIIGTYIKDTKLWTGEYCDVKSYEIFKENYKENL